MRGDGLGGRADRDRSAENGVPPLPVRALQPDSEKAARLLNQFIEQARQAAGRQTACQHASLLRGFAKLPSLPTYPEMFGLHAAAIAVNGMYRGVARLAGWKCWMWTASYARR